MQEETDPKGNQIEGSALSCFSALKIKMVSALKRRNNLEEMQQEQNNRNIEVDRNYDVDEEAEIHDNLPPAVGANVDVEDIETNLSVVVDVHCEGPNEASNEEAGFSLAAAADQGATGHPMEGECSEGETIEGNHHLPTNGQLDISMGARPKQPKLQFQGEHTEINHGRVAGARINRGKSRRKIRIDRPTKKKTHTNNGVLQWGENESSESDGEWDCYDAYPLLRR